MSAWTDFTRTKTDARKAVCEICSAEISKGVLLPNSFTITGFIYIEYMTPWTEFSFPNLITETFGFSFSTKKLKIFMMHYVKIIIIWKLGINGVYYEQLNVLCAAWVSHLPISILSFANSNSFMVTMSFPSTAAFSADWLTRFSRSAPENPTVPLAMISASTANPEKVIILRNTYMTSCVITFF